MVDDLVGHFDLDGDNGGGSDEADDSIEDGNESRLHVSMDEDTLGALMEVAQWAKVVVAPAARRSSAFYLETLCRLYCNSFAVGDAGGFWVPTRQSTVDAEAAATVRAAAEWQIFPSAWSSGGSEMVGVVEAGVPLCMHRG